MATKQWRKDNSKKITEIQRRWYLENKEQVIKKKEERKQKIKEWLLEKKKSLKCEKCGMSHVACLQFHHTDPSKKELAIGDAAGKYGWGIERMEKEILKCKVLCANCHTILHWEERN